MDPKPRKLVRDIMTVGVATCPPDAPIKDLTRLFLEKNLEAVVVLDPADGNALGVVSQDDLVAAYIRFIEADATPQPCSDEEKQGAQPFDLPCKAADIMIEGVPQVPPDLPLAVAAQIMRDQHIRALFLMHHSAGIEYPAAILTYSHLLRHLAANSPEELKTLGIHADRNSPLEDFIRRREAARQRNLAKPEK